MAEAETKATTPPRYLTLAQAAERIGREELELALIEGRLSAWDRANRAHFEELVPFLDGFRLRGAAEADLDAVRAISRGAVIPARSWRRWFASGRINWETNEIVRMFADRVLIYQPVLLSTDVPVRSSERGPLPAGSADSPPKPQTATARWVTGEVGRLKKTGEIYKVKGITATAKLLATNMLEAAKTDSTLHPVSWQYIKNMLPRWGLWPIPSI